MTLLWMRGLIRRRGARLAATATGIALAVALIVTLGTFLASSQATMTTRATSTVAVDWQVEVQHGRNVADVGKQLRTDAKNTTVEQVLYAPTTGLKATTGGTTQNTGPGQVLGIPAGYAASFPGEIRQLTGAKSGVLIAQQTAANLHVRPGDKISIGRTGTTPATVTIAGVVDLPQADSLFQRVGAPPGSQPAAPPDNVVLLPQSEFSRIFHGANGSQVTTQFHVARGGGSLPTNPAGAYEQVTRAANHLEAASAGAASVGDNLGAALGSAREDAAYAQMLFLFLGLPGAVLATLLTAAVVGAGADRRRGEQALLRVRGHSIKNLVGLAAAEAAVVALVGAIAGIALAALTARTMLGLGHLPGAALAAWATASGVFALVVAAAIVLVPAVRDLRGRTVADTTRSVRAASRSRLPWWLRAGVDLLLLAGAAVVFWMSSSNNYKLVLAPEGVVTVSVSYWAFLGPALLWLGAAGLLARIVLLVLGHARKPLATVLRPLTGRLASSGAASLSRQRPSLARAVVLLALALSFAASTATFNATYQQQAEADAQLTNGADVTVTEPPGVHVPPTASARLAAVPGVKHAEPMQHRFAYVGSDLQDLYGVNPNTISSVTAIQDSYFTGGNAADLMHRLAAHPDSILVSAETVKDFQLSPGDLIRLRLQDATTKQTRTVPFHYAGIVNEFPTAPKDSFFVANASYIAKTTGSNTVGAFLLDTGGQHQQAVAARVRSMVGAGAKVTDLSATRGKVGSSLTSVDLSGLTRVELTYAILLAVAAGGFVLGLGLAERRRSLAIMSLLGATRAQRRGLVLAEGLLITVGGLIGGAVIGTALTQVLVKVLTGVFDPPPSSIAVPVGYLVGTALAITVALLIAALAGARATTRSAVEELREL